MTLLKHGLRKFGVNWSKEKESQKLQIKKKIFLYADKVFA